MTNTSNRSTHPLHDLSQTIHATLLSPPAQFLLVSSVNNDQWCICLFNTTKSVSKVWSIERPLKQIADHGEKENIEEAIRQGLLHVDCGTKRQVDLTTLNTIDLHILIQPNPLILNLKEGDIDDHISKLMNATYKLLSRPEGKSKQNGNTADSDVEVRELKLQLSQRDAEIANLNSRLSSLKATIVRATASDVNKKKVQQSPQKQKPLPGASQLQPNQKRRKVVEDEFAGSSSDEDD
ncbi:uncharacterized protein L199_007083 [Kwoniella botswanensis]|uniref:uncharacterized protein n=1 Tax=Kwoniella botswanensis TaxID=1268659 RepID=UPI00315D2CFA